MTAPLLMGAVAYDAKVVPIWQGFRDWLRAAGLPFDFVLYAHYERQVEDLVAGRIDAAWNSPLAWVRAQRLARSEGVELSPLVMRDTDRDLRSVVVVRDRDPYHSLVDLREAIVAVGAIDSPQATLLPLSLFRQADVDPEHDLKVRRHDIGVGLHGDHVGGEREAARALGRGEVAAACMLDSSHLLFTQEGTLHPGATRIIAATAAYDHCNMTIRAGHDAADRFEQLLLSMRYDDPDVRYLLEMEGLRTWEPGRNTGYSALDLAVDEAGFYDAAGRVTADDYGP